MHTEEQSPLLKPRQTRHLSPELHSAIFRQTKVSSSKPSSTNNVFEFNLQQMTICDDDDVNTHIGEIREATAQSPIADETRGAVTGLDYGKITKNQIER